MPLTLGWKFWPQDYQRNVEAYTLKLEFLLLLHKQMTSKQVVPWREIRAYSLPSGMLSSLGCNLWSVVLTKNLHSFLHACTGRVEACSFIIARWLWYSPERQHKDPRKVLKLRWYSAWISWRSLLIANPAHPDCCSSHSKCSISTLLMQSSSLHQILITNL